MFLKRAAHAEGMTRQRSAPRNGLMAGLLALTIFASTAVAMTAGSSSPSPTPVTVSFHHDGDGGGGRGDR